MASRTKRTASRAKKSLGSSKRKMKGKTRSIMKIGSASGLKLPVEDIRGQLFSYADQIQQYLAKVNAKVDTFNFAVEKSDKGLVVDCAVKAMIGA